MGIEVQDTFTTRKVGYGQGIAEIVIQIRVGRLEIIRRWPVLIISSFSVRLSNAELTFNFQTPLAAL